MNRQILIINTGSTSSKIALFEDGQQLWQENIKYSREQLKPFLHIEDQLDLRMEGLNALLDEKGVQVGDLWAISARGATVYPIEGGTYIIDDEMIDEAIHNPCVEHAANLACMMAHRLAGKSNVPAFIVDAGLMDEMIPEARLTGIKGIMRRAQWHALSQRAIARKLAEDMGKEFDEINCVVCHMGGGTSVGAHKKGRSIDVNNCLDGDGAMSAERAGSIPNIEILKMAFEQKLSEREIWKRMVGNGGLISHLGTSDLIEVEKRIEAGDTEAKLVLDAMIHQVAKEIGAYATTLNGKIDAIAITGGMAYSEYLVKNLVERVGFLAPVRVYPGECEMEALYLGAKRVMDGKETARHFKKSGINHQNRTN